MNLLYEAYCKSNAPHICCKNLYDMSCEIEYNDDTYDVFKIFEYDMNVNTKEEK